MVASGVRRALLHELHTTGQGYNEMQNRSSLRVEIAGLGAYVPDRVLSNEDLEKIVDTSDEWITQRTGIKERRILAENEATSDLAAAASVRALEMAETDPSELDMILIATCTPDYFFPATGCLVASRIGASNAAAYDIEAACSGFTFGLAQGGAAIVAGLAANVLVVGAEALSRFTDYEDRRSCILFGDGAGAAVLRRASGASEVIYTELGSDGSKEQLLILPGAGSRHPASHQSVDEKQHFMKIQGREVFRLAVNKLTELMLRVPERTGVSLEDIDLIIPHQSNYRIINSACERVGVPVEKAYMNIDRFGNTSAASIPIAMDEAARNGRMRRGNLVLLLAFGGGITWASVLLRY